jgi:GMP synthase-like glutamine amidotransferase
MMKIGILDALSSDELVDIRWRGSTAGTYIRLLESADAPFTYRVYQVNERHLPATVDECDAYLITGSINGAYDDEPWIGDLISFIQACHAAGKKMVGICFGHQILAHALGGRTEKSEKGWGLGLKTFNFVGSKPWMESNPGDCSLYFSHQDQVVELPEEAEWLGGNEFCENVIFAIRDQVLGIQGHPEFTKEIMSDILSKLEEDTVAHVWEQADRSLTSGDPDNERVARWIVNFLKA